MSENTSKFAEAFDADAILSHLGLFGRFQLMFFAFLAFAVLFPMASILVFSLTGATPAHRCFIDGCDNITDPQYLADWMMTSTILDHLHNDWRCRLPNSTVATCATGNFTTNSTCQHWIYDKSIFTTTIVSDFDLVCDESWKVTFVSSLTMVGVMVGAFVLGPLPDLIGRRKAVFILSIWMSTFAISSSFPPNFAVFAVLRFLTGMGGIALLQSLMIWGVEAMSPTIRVKFIFLIYCFQALGILLTGLMAYFIRNWVYLQLSLFVPMTLMTTYYFFLPESARWLTVQKRFPEAKKVYELAARMNKKEIPLHLLESPSTVAADLKSICAPVKLSDNKSWIAIVQVIKTPCLLKRLLILFCVWASSILSYYGLSYSASHLSSDVHLNFILVILVEIPAYLIGMFVVEYFGRRLTLNVALIAGGFFCLVAGLVPQIYNGLVIFFSLCGKFFISLQLVTVNTITTELFPTPARGITIALCSTMAKIGGILSPLLSVLGATNRSLPYVIFGIINLIVGFLTFFLPETKGMSMPATVQEAIDLEKTAISFPLICRKKTTVSEFVNLHNSE